MQGSGSRVQGSGFRALMTWGYGVSGFWFLVSGFGIRSSGFGLLGGDLHDRVEDHHDYDRHDLQRVEGEQRRCLFVQCAYRSA